MIKKGDFVELDYTGKLDDGSVFDTTNVVVAKKHSIFSDGAVYKPIVICVGDRHIVKGVDEVLVGKPMGSFSVNVSAIDAFGKKNAKLVQMIPLSKFAEQKIQPVPGLRLNIDGSVGIVKTVSGGRVVVDFNHPLAGKDVVYDVNIHKIVTDKKVQVEALLYRLMGVGGVPVSVDGDKVTIEFPADLPKAFLDKLGEKIEELTKVKVSFVVKKPKSE